MRSSRLVTWRGPAACAISHVMLYNTFQMKDECPRLEEVTSVAVEVVCETNFSPSVHRDSNTGRLLMEGLFAHFFSPHRLEYHVDDCRWFLELANRQHHWQPGFLEQSVVVGGLEDDLVKELEQKQPSGLLQVGFYSLHFSTPSSPCPSSHTHVLPTFPSSYHREP